MAKFGWNFRMTAEFVTDGADQTYVLINTDGTTTDDDTTARNGIATEWVGFDGSNALWRGRDRVNTNDPRLAGCNVCLNADGPRVFRIYKSGSMKVRVALGDASFSTSNNWLVCRDSAGTKFAIEGVDTSNDQKFLDAVGNEWDNTGANGWPDNNVQVGPFEFADYVEFVLGHPTGGEVVGFSSLCHIELEEDDEGGGGPAEAAMVLADTSGNPLAENGGTHNAGVCDIEESVSDTFRIYNDGEEAVTLDFSTFAVTGDGTLTSIKDSDGTDIEDDHELAADDYVTVVVARDTSAAGPQAYSIAFDTTDADGFEFVVSFTVLSGGGGGSSMPAIAHYYRMMRGVN